MVAEAVVETAGVARVAAVAVVVAVAAENGGKWRLVDSSTSTRKRKSQKIQ